jgi:hypothetical protein
MSKYAAFVILFALRILYHPSAAQVTTAPFGSPALLSAKNISFVPARLISFDGSISNHKVILNWEVAENETADQFEVEKSIDGKTFFMAALVFGTDKSDKDKYQFYEKAGNQKVLYRIKIINKNRQTAYSSVIEINPTV